MSHRPIAQKRAARMRKAIMRNPLPAFIDPVHWLRQRRYVQTNGEARKLILDGRLKAESHPVGITQEPRLQPDGSVRDEKVIAHVPAAVADKLYVTRAIPADASNEPVAA